MKRWLADLAISFFGLMLLLNAHDIAQAHRFDLIWWLAAIPGCLGIALMRIGAQYGARR